MGPRQRSAHEGNCAGGLHVALLVPAGGAASWVWCEPGGVKRPAHEGHHAGRPQAALLVLLVLAGAGMPDAVMPRRLPAAKVCMHCAGQLQCAGRLQLGRTTSLT